MAEIKTIKIIYENSGVGKNGQPYKRYVFEFEDGYKISTFDTKIGTAFKPGETVSIEVGQKGQYSELLSIVPFSGTIPPKTTQISSDREKSIIAQTLTKCWAETQTEARDAGVILETYKYFLENI